MPRKRILRNHCNKCMYQSSDRESAVCACGICAYYDDSYELGCNYKPLTLRNLYIYTGLELSEEHSCRFHDLFSSWEQAQKDIWEKVEKREKISAQEMERFRLLSDDARTARMMEFDHKRCNYIRLINVLDKKGEFKRLLRKLGRYPKFIDDFTIGIEKEEM